MACAGADPDFSSAGSGPRPVEEVRGLSEKASFFDD
jgi:hypothetical protein